MQMPIRCDTGSPTAGLVRVRVGKSLLVLPDLALVEPSLVRRRRARLALLAALLATLRLAPRGSTTGVRPRPLNVALRAVDAEHVLIRRGFRRVLIAEGEETLARPAVLVKPLAALKPQVTESLLDIRLVAVLRHASDEALTLLFLLEEVNIRQPLTFLTLLVPITRCIRRSANLSVDVSRWHRACCEQANFAASALGKREVKCTVYRLT